MIDILTLSSSLMLALQPAAQDTLKPAITDLSQLPLEEATGPRCGVVFALVEGLQGAGDKRARQYPDLASTNGREFFVRSMAKLMEDRGIDRERVKQIIARETDALSQDNHKSAHELMEPCLLMKQAAGL